MRILPVILSISFFISHFSTIAQLQSAKEEKEIYRAVLLIGKAWTQNNLDTLEKYIHKDYLHTDVQGQILNRSSWLSYVKDRKEKNVSNPTLEFEDVRISIHSDLAFVTGINIFSGQAYTANDNSTKPRKLRFTQVMKKENGIWKRILFQATYVN